MSEGHSFPPAISSPHANETSELELDHSPSCWPLGVRPIRGVGFELSVLMSYEVTRDIPKLTSPAGWNENWLIENKFFRPS
jgi:hypothetical protein